MAELEGGCSRDDAVQKDGQESQIRGTYKRLLSYPFFLLFFLFFDVCFCMDCHFTLIFIYFLFIFSFFLKLFSFMLILIFSFCLFLVLIQEPSLTSYPILISLTSSPSYQIIIYFPFYHITFYSQSYQIIIYLGPFETEVT